VGPGRGPTGETTRVFALFVSEGITESRFPLGGDITDNRHGRLPFINIARKQIPLV